jgi:NitT/TauT family transport system substrate-binding protein
VTTHGRASKRLLGGAAALLSVVVATTSCGSSNASSSKTGSATKAPTTVNVGAIASTLYLPFYVAMEQGYFAEQGLTMNITNIANSQPLVTGSVDLQLTALDTSIIDAASGKPTPAIAILQQRNGLSLYVRADKATSAMSGSYPSNVTALKSLGKTTIAVTNLASGAAPFVLGTLKDAGLVQDQDFSIISLQSGPNIMAALQAKRIDATLLFPPFDAQAEAQGLAKPLVNQGKGEGPSTVTQLYGAAVIANQDWAKKNPQLVTAVNAAVSKAAAFMRDYDKNKATVIKIAQKYTGVADASVLEADLPTIAKLATTEATCDRVTAHAKIDQQFGVVQTVPNCYDIIDAGAYPHA